MIIALMLGFILIGGSMLFGKEYLKVLRAPKVQNQAEFAKEFDPTGKESITIPCTGLEGCTLYSPFFPPFRQLERKTIVRGDVHYLNEENLSTEGRYIAIDSFWHVFWIGIEKFPVRERFFGPFRY